MGLHVTPYGTFYVQRSLRTGEVMQVLPVKRPNTPSHLPSVDTLGITDNFIESRRASIAADQARASDSQDRLQRELAVAGGERLLATGKAVLAQRDDIGDRSGGSGSGGIPPHLLNGDDNADAMDMDLQQTVPRRPSSLEALHEDPYHPEMLSVPTPEQLAWQYQEQQQQQQQHYPQQEEHQQQHPQMHPAHAWSQVTENQREVINLPPFHEIDTARVLSREAGSGSGSGNGYGSRSSKSKSKSSRNSGSSSGNGNSNGRISTSTHATAASYSSTSSQNKGYHQAASADAGAASPLLMGPLSLAVPAQHSQSGARHGDVRMGQDWPGGTNSSSAPRHGLGSAELQHPPMVTTTFAPPPPLPPPPPAPARATTAAAPARKTKTVWIIRTLEPCKPKKKRKSKGGAKSGSGSSTGDKSRKSKVNNYSNDNDDSNDNDHNDNEDGDNDDDDDDGDDDDDEEGGQTMRIKTHVETHVHGGY